MVVVAAGIQAVGAITGSVIQSSAAQGAANTEASAAEAGQQLSESQFNKTQANLKPFIQAGQQALPQYENLIGTGPGGPGGIANALGALPGYQFTLGQGLQATQNGFAAQGLANSGAALKGAANYATGLAQSNWQNYITPVQALVGSGQNAAGNLGSLGLQSAGQQASLGVAAGQAQAAGTIGSANALASGLSGLGQSALLASLGNSGLFGNNNNQSNSPYPSAAYLASQNVGPGGFIAGGV